MIYRRLHLAKLLSVKSDGVFTSKLTKASYVDSLQFGVTNIFILAHEFCFDSCRA